MLRKYIDIVVSHFNLGCMYRFCGHWRKVLVDVCRCSFPVKFEGFGVEGRSHVTMVAKFLDLNKLWSCKSGRKKNEKIDVYDFPGMICTPAKR